MALLLRDGSQARRAEACVRPGLARDGGTAPAHWDEARAANGRRAAEAGGGGSGKRSFEAGQHARSRARENEPGEGGANGAAADGTGRQRRGGDARRWSDASG